MASLDSLLRTTMTDPDPFITAVEGLESAVTCVEAAWVNATSCDSSYRVQVCIERLQKALSIRDVTGDDGGDDGHAADTAGEGKPRTAGDVCPINNTVVDGQ